MATKGKMTKAEQAYAWWLKKEEMEGRLVAWYFERLTLTLTRGRRPGSRAMVYTPDFLVVLLGPCFRIVEIKGPYTREDSVLKFKMAADLFPYFEWQMIQIGTEGKAKVVRNIPAADGKKLCAPDGSDIETLAGGISGKDHD
jgi:hypothetical protein